MASFLRISDIMPYELHLLPIADLGEQIRADHQRPSEGRTHLDGLRSDPSGPNEDPDPGTWRATAARFVTDWQLQYELGSGSRYPFGREENDDERGDDDFDALYVDIGGEG